MIALKKIVHLVNPSWRYSPSKNGQNGPKMGQKSIFGPRGQQGGPGTKVTPSLNYPHGWVPTQEFWSGSVTWPTLQFGHFSRASPLKM